MDAAQVCLGWFSQEQSRNENLYVSNLLENAYGRTYKGVGEAGKERGGSQIRV